MFFHRLNVNEALARLENHIQHISSADIYTEPPCDSGSISEEDSDDEDQPSDLTHLSGKQLDASAELVLHQPINANSIDNDETEIRITEPLPKKNKNYHKKSIRQWTSDDLISEPPQSTDPPKYFEKQWSPADVFEFFFDDEVIEQIIQFSKSYAADKASHQFHVTKEEMRAFLALLLLSGYVSLPRRRMYWEKLPDVNNKAVASTMSRHRFEEILRFLHLADNNHLQKEDKFAKIRPLVSLLNAKWLAHFPKENFLAVDEAMVPYFGRNGLKQHIHGKPIRFGYKVWCLCTRTGYLAQAIPYQGSTTGYSNPEFGMGGSVVLDLISELPSEVEYRLFFDNLFTSIPPIDHLKQSNIGATGTIRVNRTDKTPLLDLSCMKKKTRGTYCQAKDEDSGCILVRWNDNSVVTLTSNCYGVNPVRSASRWSNAEKKRISIDQPDVIYQYNQFMGGVDRLDENIAKVRVAIRMKKWWWPMFRWLLNVSVNNAWQTYRMLARSQQLESLD